MLPTWYQPVQRPDSVIGTLDQTEAIIIMQLVLVRCSTAGKRCFTIKTTTSMIKNKRTLQQIFTLLSFRASLDDSSWHLWPRRLLYTLMQARKSQPHGADIIVIKLDSELPTLVTTWSRSSLSHATAQHHLDIPRRPPDKLTIVVPPGPGSSLLMKITQ